MEYGGIRMEYVGVWVEYEWDVGGMWKEGGWNYPEIRWSVGGICMEYGWSSWVESGRNVDAYERILVDYEWNITECGWSITQYGCDMNGIWMEHGGNMDGIRWSMMVWVGYGWGMEGA